MTQLEFFSPPQVSSFQGKFPRMLDNDDKTTHVDETATGTLSGTVNDWKPLALQDLAEGVLSLTEVAKKYGRAYDTVRKLMNREGVHRKKVKGGPKPLATTPPISPMHKALGIRLNMHRVEQHLSLNQMANQLSTSVMVVRYIEAGLEDLPLSRLIEIAGILGLPLTQACEPHRFAKLRGS